MDNVVADCGEQQNIGLLWATQLQKTFTLCQKEVKEWKGKNIQHSSDPIDLVSMAFKKFQSKMQDANGFLYHYELQNVSYF